MQVGFVPGDIVLDEDPALAPKKGISAPTIRHMSVSRWMDQYAIWYGGRSRPRAQSVRWRLSSPKKGYSAPTPISAHVCWDQTAGWMEMPLGTEVGLGPRQYCLRSRPSPLPKTGAQQTHHFSARVYCGQTAGWITMPFGTEIGLIPGHIVSDGNPAPPTERGTAALTFRPVSVVAKQSPISATAELLFSFYYTQS